MAGSVPVPVVDLLPGVVVTSGTTLAVNVNGATPSVWWAAGYIPQVGDSVKVLLVNGTAHVLGPVVDTVRTLTGTISGAASGGLVPVDTTEGTVSARYVGTAPTIGTLVFLDWQATTPRLMSTFAAATTTAPVVEPDAPPPPPAITSGQHSATPLDSGTYNSSTSSWSGFHGFNLVQGTYSGTYHGSYFYGAAPQQIAGRTVTGAAIRLGARLRIGNYNSALTLNLYRHTSLTRPGGDVSRVEGPHSIVLDPGAGAGWYSLPTSWGQALADSGGGISVSGGTYGGVHGIDSDPASGQLAFNWEA